MKSDAEFLSPSTARKFMGSGYGESEKRLREVFEEASRAAPARSSSSTKSIPIAPQNAHR